MGGVGASRGWNDASLDECFRYVFLGGAVAEVTNS